MPPPPPGMHVLDGEEKKQLLGSAAADGSPRRPTRTWSPSPPRWRSCAPWRGPRWIRRRSPTRRCSSPLRRLGVANPLRLRMLDALEEPILREDDTPPELPLIKDLENFDVAQIQDRYDIPVEMQPLVAQYIQFFQGPGRKWYRKWVSRSTRYLPVMQPILEQKGLPRDTVYLAMIESGFSSTAYSWAHAAGPWQFISGTGAHVRPARGLLGG